MSQPDIEIVIDKVVSKSKGKRFILVTLMTSSYGGGSNMVHEAFSRRDWKLIKHDRKYRDSQRVDVSLATKLNVMTEEEYIEYHRKLWLNNLSDEELVEEVNKRIQSGKSEIELKHECHCELAIKEYDPSDYDYED